MSGGGGGGGGSFATTGTENVELAKRFAIGGFPTLILFADRHMYIHNGERTLTSLKSFLLEVASGSYNSEAQAQVPAEPSWLGVQLRRDPFLAGLSEDFSHILEVPCHRRYAPVSGFRFAC